MTNLVFLQAATAAAGQASQQPGGKQQWTFWAMMILIFIVFYFFMIRPQTKKQKELQKQRDAMRKGDKVITAGGIYGVIKEVNDTTLLLEVAKDMVIKVDKSSVTPIQEEVQADAAKK